MRTKSKSRRPDPRVLVAALRDYHAKRRGGDKAPALPPLEPPSVLMDRPNITLNDIVGVGESLCHWENSTYYGVLRRYASGFPIGGGPYAILSITPLDESARHDWREYQQLKNLLLGEEWEALELYPAEDRLKDPSNRFYLWCVPSGVISWGLPGGRLVLHPDEAHAPQRPFPQMEDH